MNPASGEARGARALLHLYIGLFYLYLFAPLLVMSLAAFNDYPYPSVTQWGGFTLRWFSALLDDQRMRQGVLHSLVIAAGVVSLSVPLGLAGAMVLYRIKGRAAGFLYAIMVSPILTPGIIIGLSTLIFWRELGVPGGKFTAVMAQTTFIASYAMLMFLARLQRFDPTLEEAAYDLGASAFLVFRRILLPFLAPTILTASIIAFLQSVENYNTTVFSIGGDWTLVTEIGSRFRFGLSPVINVIGVLFVIVTVLCASLWVWLHERRRLRPQHAG